ncbi:MAG: hypothetical protein M3306_11775 [Actinomycetota bacterium]|nr:hypothetical protein [Actinomycetota bacterium]
MNHLFSSLLDDAAVFPPGNLLLVDAVPHDKHRAASYADLVGSFVLAAKDLDALAPLVADDAPGSLTAPLPDAQAALTTESIPAVRVTNREVAIPDGIAAEDVAPSLQDSLAGRGLSVYVEIPRAHRRPALVSALSGTGYLAKLRTGGVRADLYPDEKELAEALVALADAVRAGADVDELVVLLAERDPERVVTAVRGLGESVRDTFRSFGTCAITEPAEELGAVGLLDPTTTEGLE